VVNVTQRISSFLPRGLREPLVLMLLAGVVALAGSYSGAFDLYAPLALWPVGFWHGRVWQAVTYPLLPAGPADLIFNGFLFAVLGGRLVQGFGRRQFWLFCLVAVVGSAVVKLALTALDHRPLVSFSSIVFAMFAAWCRLFANEEVMLMATWRMRMRTAILIIAGLIIMFGLLSSCGFWNAVAVLGGGATGWLYLAAQERWRLRRRARTLPSERISRLEL
jgi:membrane associated rhomboid family serine protease